MNLLRSPKRRPWTILHFWFPLTDLVPMILARLELQEAEHSMASRQHDDDGESDEDSEKAKSKEKSKGEDDTGESGEEKGVGEDNGEDNQGGASNSEAGRNH
ncbi:unnamed protein product, partial [Symbiodinium microadriaticum]